MSRPRRRVSRLAIGACAALVLCLPATAASTQERSKPTVTRAETETPRLADLPLSQALRRLQEQGLKIVFTSNVVRAGMRVASQPGGHLEEPQALLAELLAPHDLEARNAPNQTFVVVPRTRSGAARPVPDPSRVSLGGVVRSRRDTLPIEGVGVRVLETGAVAVSAADGSFAIPGLAPGSVTLEVRRRGFVVETLEQVPVSSSGTELDILLDPAPVTEEVVVVKPSRISLLRREPAAPVALSRDAILALPHLGDDFFRALSLLPGVAANDASARFSIRGGRRDETRILLDGQELYETFHLKDFDSAQSIIAPTTLESVDLSTGSFSAEHGDRMGGVLDMTTRTPTGPTQGRLGLGILGAEIGGAGTFGSQRGSWIAQGRRGANDFAGKLIGPERPVYWDIFGKVDFQLTPRYVLRVNVLRSDDEFDFREVTTDGQKDLATDYLSSYLWLTDQRVLNSKAFFETAISHSRVERDRNGVEADEDVRWTIGDRRALEVAAVRQSWNVQVHSGNYLELGFELRDFDTSFDYRSDYEFDAALADLRTNGPEGSIAFEQRLVESHGSLYVTDRLDLGEATTLELGLRYDDHSQTRESHLTPRLNLARILGPNTILRAAWGLFNQSQRPYELAVEDGDTAFRRIERSEHRLLGFEHSFQGKPQLALTLRLEAYQREIDRPQPRWINLYEPLNEFQEVEPDRVRITPERSYAEGLEVFLSGSAGARIDWFANYALASSEDEIGGRRQPRELDQTHTLNLDLDYRINDAWTLNVAWRYHTGWPTTPLGVRPVMEEPEPEEDEEGDFEPEIVFEPVLGAPFGSRLDDYHRLDLRLGRRWRNEAGTFVFYLDVQNVYDRKNQAGFDYEIEEDDGTILPNVEEWAGFFPSLGIRWEF